MLSRANGVARTISIAITMNGYGRLSASSTIDTGGPCCDGETVKGYRLSMTLSSHRQRTAPPAAGSTPPGCYQMFWLSLTACRLWLNCGVGPQSPYAPKRSARAVGLGRWCLPAGPRRRADFHRAQAYRAQLPQDSNFGLIGRGRFTRKM
jgi:hypothetical protein